MIRTNLGRAAVMAMVVACAAPAEASTTSAPASASVGANVSSAAPVDPPALAPQVGLGALQLVAGVAAELGGTAGLAALGLYPKGLGIHSDYANLAFVGIVAPALAGGAVCGTGLLNRSYRGRCSTTFLGAYVGAALGVLIGVALAPKPNPDDTVEFTQTIGGLVGLALLSPVGAVVGYHLGKERIVEAPAPAAPVVRDGSGDLGPMMTESPRDKLAPPSAGRWMLPVLSLAW